MSYAAIGLHRPKHHANVGAALRAASAYGAAMVVTTGRRYKRASTDTVGAHLRIPLVQVADLHDAVPFDCVPVAVELVAGAEALYDYEHPARAFYVFGPEDGTLGRSVLSWCRDVVQIPAAHCLNLAATVGTVLYDRAAKVASNEAHAAGVSLGEWVRQ